MDSNSSGSGAYASNPARPSKKIPPAASSPSSSSAALARVSSSAGDFPSAGGRADVFSGLPHTLYLPIDTRFTLTASSPCDLAFCYSLAEERHPAALVTPADVRVEIRGGGNATRQINHMIQPGFPAHRILICEVYTPGGNWSSYPPHKHDVHNPPG